MKRALFVVPLVLIAACSGSSNGTKTAAPSTPAAASPSVSPDPSPVASPTPSRATTRSAAPGDVDGDGEADEVTVTAEELTVRLSGGGTVTARIVDSDVPKPVVSGLHDLDLDGRNEIWVETARGASTSFVQAYRYDGTSLSEVTYQGGHIRFGIGGSVTHGDGFRCTDGGWLLVRTAESDDGSTFRVRTRTFRLVKGTLSLESEAIDTAPSMDDPRVRAAYQVDCGSVGESD